LGINLGFAANRYIEPEVWTRIVGDELGLKYVQFTADLLNPFWPEDYIDAQLARLADSTKRHGIRVESIFTSTYTRVNHLLNPDRAARDFWLSWFERFLEIGSNLGVRNGGSHFGIMTFDTYDHPDQRKYVLEEGVKGWRRLTKRAKELGYRELIFEPMSVPREMACTIAETRELMDMVNEDAGVPMRLCIDVGHAPHPDERDAYLWLEKLGAFSPVIHLQQTVMHKSNHAPFTDEFNATGYITKEKVLESVRHSGNRDALFAFEISHREHYDTEFRIIQDLKRSVDYFRTEIPD
jgi:hypothetical protein